MKILFIGDIVGKASRKKIKEIIPTLKSKYNTDMIIANGENATSGYGLSKKDAEELFSSGLIYLHLGIMHGIKEICFLILKKIQK